MGKISINIATGSLQQAEMIVGIDLGTTNSLIAIVHPDTKQPVCLKEHNANSIVLSGEISNILSASSPTIALFNSSK